MDLRKLTIWRDEWDSEAAAEGAQQVSFSEFSALFDFVILDFFDLIVRDQRLDLVQREGLAKVVLERRFFEGWKKFEVYLGVTLSVFNCQFKKTLKNIFEKFFSEISKDSNSKDKKKVFLVLCWKVCQTDSKKKRHKVRCLK